MIAIVVAHDRLGNIGYRGQIPWRGYLPADMERFKRLTIHGVVVMGRKTWESLPPKYRPLPSRDNVVVSRTANKIEGALVYSSLDRALAVLDKMTTDYSAPGANNDVYVIGGGEIYRQALPFASRAYVTVVDGSFIGDTTFSLDEDWQVMETEQHPADVRNAFQYTFLTYERIRHESR